MSESSESSESSELSKSSGPVRGVPAKSLENEARESPEGIPGMPWKPLGRLPVASGATNGSGKRLGHNHRIFKVPRGNAADPNEKHKTSF